MATATVASCPVVGAPGPPRTRAAAGNTSGKAADMKKRKRKGNQKQHHKPTAVAPRLQIKTTIDFGEDGVPLDNLGDVMRALRERHLDILSKASHGFVPIPFDDYVNLHVQNNPDVDRRAFARRLRDAIDARKAGARCACGALIWAIGSAEVGQACFACITGEARPDADYEIDEALGLSTR